MPVSELVKLLVASKRPLFHIGNGARDCADEFFALIEYLQIPFVTARNANDLCASDHPFYVGRPGTFAQRGANFAVQSCDLYIAIGTRLSLAQTGYNSMDYARGAQIIQVNISQPELDKGTLRNPVNLCMDAAVFIRELAGYWEYLSGCEWNAWVARCRSWRERYPVCLPEYAKQNRINGYYFITKLSECLDEGDTIVTDMGHAFQVTHQAFKVKRGQRLMTNCGLAPMGWGLPAAVGAAFATGRRVICITGDGGLMMNLQELATVKHHKLNIKIFVLNNDGYLTIKQTQELGFDGRIMGATKETGISFPDLWNLGQAFGIKRGNLHSHFQLETLGSLIYGDEPYLCDVWMTPDQPQQPRALNRRNADGTMNPTKLEDSFPFLPPEVIAKEMQCD